MGEGERKGSMGAKSLLVAELDVKRAIKEHIGMVHRTSPFLSLTDGSGSRKKKSTTRLHICFARMDVWRQWTQALRTCIQALKLC